MIAAPARLPSPHQGLPSTPWQALRRAAARISSFLEETPLRAVSRLRTFMAAIALALTPTPHRERLPAHRFRRRLAPPRPTHHSGILSRNPVFIPRPHPPPKTTPRRHPSYPRRRVSTPTTHAPQTEPKSTPRRPKSFLEKTLIARETPDFRAQPAAHTPTTHAGRIAPHPTPVASSSLALWESNCVGRQALGHGRIPGGLLLAEGVAEHQQLAHAGDQGHLGRLAGGDEALVVGPQAGIEARGGQGGHVQHGTDRSAPAPAAAAPTPGAAVAVEGGHADQGGDLLAGAGAEFGHFGQQGRGGHGPMPGMLRRPAARACNWGSACRAAATSRSSSRSSARSRARWASRRGQRAGGAWRRRCWVATRSSTSWRRSRTRARRCWTAFEGWGRTGGRTSAAKRASTPASSRSVLARVPWARAKSRVWRGLTTTTGSPGRAATTARSYPPVASSTMRLGCRAWTRACNRRRPAGERGTVQVSSVGHTATSNWAFATSIPSTMSTGAAIRYPPQALAARPTLRIRARHDGPGNCSGSGPAAGPGRPRSPTVSLDPGLVGLSRPISSHLGLSKALGTYKGWGEGLPGKASPISPVASAHPSQATSHHPSPP